MGKLFNFCLLANPKCGWTELHRENLSQMLTLPEFITFALVATKSLSITMSYNSFTKHLRRPHKKKLNAESF